MVNIDQVLNVLGNAAGETGGLQQQLRAATSATKEGITEKTAAEQQAIVNQGVVAVQQEKGQLAAQEDARRAATSFGTNMSDVSQIVTGVGDALRQSALQVIAESKNVNQIAARSDLFSNPAGFAYDLLYGDAAREKLAGAETQFDAASKVMAGLNQATQQTVATQKAIAATKSEATLAAQEDLIANTAAANAADAKMKLAGADMQYINSMDSLNARQVQLATTAYNIQAQAEQQAWMRADRERARVEKLDAKKGDDILLNYYNTGARAMGQPEVSSMGGLRALSSVNKKKMDYILNRGAEILDTGTARMASNPFEALSAVQQFNLPLNPAQTQVAKKFNAELGTALQVGSIEEVLIAQGADPKTVKRAAMEMAGDKKQWPRLQEDWLKLKALKDQEVVAVGDPSNIYAPPALEFLAGKTELDSNPFLMKYIKPVVAVGGGATFDPSQFLSFAAKASLEDKMSVSDITDGIVWMANQARLSNNATVAYHKTFGVEPQQKLVMPTIVEGGSMFGDSVKNVDITDPTAVTSRVLDAIAASKRSASISLAGGMSNSPFGNIFGGSSNP